MPDTIPAATVVEALRAALAPIVGDTMATASPRAIAKKLSLDAPVLTYQEAMTLVEKVCQGLVVFVGRERALETQQSVRRKLPHGEAR